jgi:hypothetical protein
MPNYEHLEHPFNSAGQAAKTCHHSHVLPVREPVEPSIHGTWSFKRRGLCPPGSYEIMCTVLDSTSLCSTSREVGTARCHNALAQATSQAKSSGERRNRSTQTPGRGRGVRTEYASPARALLSVQSPYL